MCWFSSIAAAIRLRQPPAGDHADAFPRLPVVGDTREQSAQLDHRRKLAALVEGVADRGGLCLGDGEHGWRMGMCDRQRNAA